MRRRNLIVYVIAGISVLVAGAAIAASPPSKVVLDRSGDTVFRGKKVSNRPDADIRSVTISRSKKELHITVLTAAPLRPGTVLWFRFADADETDLGTVDVEVNGGGAVAHISDDSEEGMGPYPATIAGRLLTVTVDDYWFPPPFLWVAILRAPTPGGPSVAPKPSFPDAAPYVRDAIPDQPTGFSVLINPKYARFP